PSMPTLPSMIAWQGGRSGRPRVLLGLLGIISSFQDGRNNFGSNCSKRLIAALRSNRGGLNDLNVLNGLNQSFYYLAPLKISRYRLPIAWYRFPISKMSGVRTSWPSRSCPSGDLTRLLAGMRLVVTTIFWPSSESRRSEE